MSRPAVQPDALSGHGEQDGAFVPSVHALACRIREELQVPLGVLELVERRVELPADLRPLIGPAQTVIQELSEAAARLERLARPKA
ncbi:MAG TPA: hypothetical protein VII06_38440 [Chloroflexota bacterium]|jgi:hypothetical protein